MIYSSGTSYSLRLAIELHHSYRIKGFKPFEFYEYITGTNDKTIHEWSEAIINIKNFIDTKDISDEIH